MPWPQTLSTPKSIGPKSLLSFLLSFIFWLILYLDSITSRMKIRFQTEWWIDPETTLTVCMKRTEFGGCHWKTSYLHWILGTMEIWKALPRLFAVAFNYYFWFADHQFLTSFRLWSAMSLTYFFFCIFMALVYWRTYYRVSSKRTIGWAGEWAWFWIMFCLNHLVLTQTGYVKKLMVILQDFLVVVRLFV